MCVSHFGLFGLIPPFFSVADKNTLSIIRSSLSFSNIRVPAGV